MSDVTPKIDDRVRLLTAVLAASNWPAMEQEQAPHAIHANAKATRNAMSEHQAHAAVSHVNGALADGMSLDALFSHCLTDETMLAELDDFGAQTAVSSLWQAHDDVWQDALSDMQAIFTDNALIAYMDSLGGQPIDKTVVVHPNLVFPALLPILAKTAESYLFILPPPKAWGESPPWPYREEPESVRADACHKLCDVALADQMATLDAEQQKTLRYAVATMFIEQSMDEANAMAYMVRSKKQHAVPRLPIVVENLRDFLNDPTGKTIVDCCI